MIWHDGIGRAPEEYMGCDWGDSGDWMVIMGRNKHLIWCESESEEGDVSSELFQLPALF